MSNATPEKSAGVPAEPYFPPPPGPPPSQQRHFDETPLREYDPSKPDFAPPTTGHHDPAFAGTAVHDDRSGHHGSSAASTSNSSGKSKSDFAERLSALGAMAASPINLLANKMGSEGFLPAAMDKECEKAARILRGFCKEGIYADADQLRPPTPPEEKGKHRQRPTKPTRALITIPAKVLQRAVGLAIFTTGRVGFHVSGATGSGVLIARLPDGGWSPPSGIQIHSVGAGFVIGADIYDCILVMNTPEAVAAFCHTRLSLGTDLAVVAGPWGAGGSVDIAASKSNKQSHSRANSSEAGAGYGSPPLPPRSGKNDGKPDGKKSSAISAVYSYIKSRGMYAGVQVDGTVVVERNLANNAFYGARVSVAQILHGQVPPGGWVRSASVLMDAIRGAEGSAASRPSSGPVPPSAQGYQQPPQQPQQPYQQPQQPYQQPQQSYQQPQQPYQQPQQSYQQSSPKTETWANAAPATIVTPRSAPAASSNVNAATTGIEQMSLGNQPTQGYSKEQEAAAEAARARADTPPPGYSHEAESSTSAHDLPPAYEGDGHYAGAGDSKTTTH